MGATHHESLLPLKMGVYATNFMLWVCLFFFFCFNQIPLMTLFIDINYLNKILQSLGVVLLAICIWIRSDSALWAYSDNMDIYRYYQATYICLAISALILVLAFLGCLSAAHEFKYLMLFVSIEYLIIIFFS